MRFLNNIYSYLTWRGDLTLSQSPFNEVDNLVLSILCYLDFSGIVPENDKQDITIQRAAAEYFSLHAIPQRPDPEKASSLELREWMLYLMADTRRFRNMRLSCLVQILDTEQVKQFSAMTILVSRKQIYLSFRGTSDDLTGWKEEVSRSSATAGRSFQRRQFGCLRGCSGVARDSKADRQRLVQ